MSGEVRRDQDLMLGFSVTGLKLKHAAMAVTAACVMITAVGCLSTPDTALGEVACSDCEPCASGEACSDCDSCNPLCYLPSPHYVRCVDEKLTRHEAAYRAEVAMRSDYNAPPSADVQAGYRAAFVDVALGASGEVPPVPPQPYWGNCYRTAEGHARAQDWFSGYETGAARAMATCRQCFNKVPSSGQTAFVSDNTSTTTGGTANQAGLPHEPAW